MKLISRYNNLDFSKEIRSEAKELSLEEQKYLLQIIENICFEKQNTLVNKK